MSLLPPVALSLGGFPLSFLFFFLPPPVSLSLRGFPSSLSLGGLPSSLLFLFPPPKLRSICGFLLLFAFFLLLPPAVSCIGPASKQMRQQPPTSGERGLSERVSLVDGQLVQARRFATVLPQAAATLLIEDPEVVLRRSVTLVGGQLVQARRFAIVLPQAAATLL